MWLSLAGHTCIMHRLTKILSFKLSSLLTYFAYFLFRRILMMPPLSFCDNKPPSDSWHKANVTIKYLAMRHANLGTDWSSRTTFLWSLCCLRMGVTCYGCQVLNNLLGIFCLTSTRLSPAKKIIIIHHIHKWRTRRKKLVPSHESEALIVVIWLAYSVSVWSLGQHVCRFSPAIAHLSSFWCFGNLQNHPVSLKIYVSLLIANSKSLLNSKRRRHPT